MSQIAEFNDNKWEMAASWLRKSNLCNLHRHISGSLSPKYLSTLYQDNEVASHQAVPKIVKDKSMTLVFATQSINKLQEAERILNIKIDSYDIDLPEIQAVEIEDVATNKARFAYSIINKPVMIEDTGLFIKILNGLPGALIKWFVQRLGTTGICKMMEQYTDKSAVARTVIAIYDGIGEPKIFIGEVKGRISEFPRGNEGFGWDAVFIPEGATKTFGEMTPQEKDKFSMRRQALEYMKSTILELRRKENGKD